MVLLTLMAIITIGVVRLRNLFAVVILFGIYSFLMATVMIVLDAPDVAMTEAAVGAGMSTVLMLGVLHLTKMEETVPNHNPWLPLFVSGVIGAILVYATFDLPDFGLQDTPVHNNVGKHYLENSIAETGVKNVVTSVLASYRGFDTLGEAVVVFAGGIGVLMLLTGDKPIRSASSANKSGSGKTKTVRNTKTRTSRARSRTAQATAKSAGTSDGRAKA